MKKIIVTFIASFFLFTMVFAQRIEGSPDDLGEKYYSQKIAFITNAMNLTPEESTLFWPLYNEFNDKEKELTSEFKKFRHEMKNKDAELTEDEAKEALLFYQNHMTKMNNLHIEYENKFLQVVPAKKVLLLLYAEKDFRRELLKKLGEHRRGGEDQKK